MSKVRTLLSSFAACGLALALGAGMTGRTLALTVRPYARRTLLALLAAGLILSFPGLTLDASVFTLENLLIISPVILIGVGLTAGITASGSMGLIAAAFQGRDLRMYLLDLEVRGYTGSRLDYIQAFVRAALFLVSFSLPLVFLVPLFNERKRCVHDFLSGSLVVRTSAVRASLGFA